MTLLEGLVRAMNALAAGVGVGVQDLDAVTELTPQQHLQLLTPHKLQLHMFLWYTCLYFLQCM